ncbi:MAG: DUF5689 domain-containing protein [Bacteroidales bacterium]
MKTFKLFILFIFGLMLTFVGCEPDIDTPPENVPVATMVSNTTILELKQYYATQNNLTTGVYSDKNYDIPYKDVASKEPFIIEGVIIANDVSGNIFKQIIIQDASAAIVVAIDASNLYTNYRIGQKVVLNCTDLTIGLYNGLIELGAPNNTRIGPMPKGTFETHVQLDGWPTQSFQTNIVTISEILNLTYNLGSEDFLALQSNLVEFEKVRFVNAGEPYATERSGSSAPTSRFFKNATAGNDSIALSNSIFSNFYTKLLPAGNGNITGILSYYQYSNGGNKNPYQVLLIDSLGVSDFKVPPVVKNIDILTLKQQYYTDSYIEIPTNANGENYVIEGVVISSDETQNISQNVIIDDGTAAITIAVKSSNLYEAYPIGTSMKVICTGLALGLYNNLQEIGIISTGSSGTTSIGTMPLETFEAHTIVGTSGNAVSPTIITPSSLPTSFTELCAYQSIFAELKDVTFKDAGQTFVNNGKNTSRTVTTPTGETFTVYFRGQCTFGTQIIPSGSGNVKGILSYYRNAYQLVPLFSTDIYGFSDSTVKSK